MFVIFAYGVDYLVDGKYKGSITITLEEGKNRKCGYEGREISSLLDNLTLSNKRVLKKRTVVTTEMIALQGKLKTN